MLARAAGTTAEIVHAPSELIASYDAEWGDSLLGDKAHSLVFDNAKIKRFCPGWEAKIPFARGAEQIIAHCDANPGERTLDAALDAAMDRIVERMRAARAGA